MSWTAGWGTTIYLPQTANICSRCCRQSGRLCPNGILQPLSTAWEVVAMSVSQTMALLSWSETFNVVLEMKWHCELTFSHYSVWWTVHQNSICQCEWNFAQWFLKHWIKCMPNLNFLAFLVWEIWVWVQMVLNFSWIVYIEKEKSMSPSTPTICTSYNFHSGKNRQIPI